MKKGMGRRPAAVSALAVLLCVAALLGTTFAWFTDTAGTAVNRIESGNLDVELWQADAEEPLPEEPLRWVKAEGHKGEAVLWEPACSYELESFRIKNNGNLALKYKIEITGLVGDAELLEVIHFSVRVSEPSLAAKGEPVVVNTAENLHGFEGCLAPQAATGIITITGKMDSAAGNEFMKKSIDNIAITVYATQDSVESDSFDNTYDDEAAYPMPLSVEKIREAYGDDGLLMPDGVVITANGGSFHTDDITVTLSDPEAYLYFTQVFDANKAYLARKANFDSVDKLSGETAERNIWFKDDSWRHPTVKLGADMDLYGVKLQPFSLFGKTTIFDGAGHALSNATVSTDGSSALFGSRVSVRNLTVKNVHVNTTSAGADAGIICAYGGSSIDNVTVVDSSVSGGKYTGAIAGRTYGDITNCTVENCVVSGQYKVGGLVGFLTSSNQETRTISGNMLRDVTVKAENVPDGKTACIGMAVGNWAAERSGTIGICENNSCTGMIGATELIGRIESNCSVTVS